MNKILKTLVVVIVVIALVGYVFELGDYDFMRQLKKIALLDFVNPIENLEILINEIIKIKDWGTLNIEWYEYIVVFFEWIGTLLLVPITFIKDLAIDLYLILQSVLIIFNFS